MTEQHVPVLAETLAEKIKLPQDAVMVDATVGHGGHSFLFGQRLGPEGVLIGFDVDEKSLAIAGERLSSLACRVELVRENFALIGSELAKLGIGEADFVLADLGICSAQLSDMERGLSVQVNMPLDMRMDERLETTAADIVNKEEESKLADIIYEFGEERGSRRIAAAIIEYRRGQKVMTTGQLASIVCRALSKPVSGYWGRIHPATKTFQALRIAVNSELENLRLFLRALPAVLKGSGRAAVISFHSLEDRIVKEDFRNNQRKGVYRQVSKKPITAGAAEVAANPRSRSAKLRIAEKR